MACCGNHGPPAACSTAQTPTCSLLQPVPVVGLRIATCQLLSHCQYDAPRAVADAGRQRLRLQPPPRWRCIAQAEAGYHPVAGTLLRACKCSWGRCAS